jgi:putative RNA 2'-phosphotransferase
VLDENGFVSVDLLLKALRKTKPGTNVTLDDIIQIVTSSEKKRHEIIGDKIRALYGHSCISIAEQIAVSPPDYLFHGTSRINLKADDIRQISKRKL